MQFLKIDSPLLINLICWYILSIQCKISYWLIYLTSKWNASCKEPCYEILSSRTWGWPKTVMFSKLQAMSTQLTEWILLCLIPTYSIFAHTGLRVRERECEGNWNLGITKQRCKMFVWSDGCRYVISWETSLRGSLHICRWCTGEVTWMLKCVTLIGSCRKGG